MKGACFTNFNRHRDCPRLFVLSASRCIPPLWRRVILGSIYREWMGISLSCYS